MCLFSCVLCIWVLIVESWYHIFITSLNPVPNAQVCVCVFDGTYYKITTTKSLFVFCFFLWNFGGNKKNKKQKRQSRHIYRIRSWRLPKTEKQSRILWNFYFPIWPLTNFHQAMIFFSCLFFSFSFLQGFFFSLFFFPSFLQ